MNEPSYLLNSPPLAEARERKTLTLRLSAEDHQTIEQAARGKGKSLNDFICEAALTAARGSDPQVPRVDAPRANVALLVDLDSFAGRSNINADALLNAAAGFGRVTRRSSFSTSVSKDLDAHRQRLLERLFRHEELPSRDALRIRMTTEALEVMRAGTATQIVIVTADESFSYTSTLLKSDGAQVVGIGVRAPADTSPSFIREFDDFRHYDQIDTPPPSKDLLELRRKYAEGLAQATLCLENRRAKPVGAALVPLLRDQHPEVSLAQLELRNWKELAEFAREQHFVEIESYGLDFLLKLTPAGRAKAEALEATRAASGNGLALLQEAVRDSIGIDLPDSKTRFLIFATAQWALEEAATQGGISLVALSHAVVDRLTHATVPQNTAFRLINGLYFAGALDTRPNPQNEKDPMIVRAKVPLTSFDDAFLLNLTRLLRKKQAAPVAPETLSVVYFGSPAKTAKANILLQIATDPSQSDRANLPQHLSRLTGVT